ncbi:CoA-transferase family III [Tropicibacter naphthalenivorans]|uniref:Putative acyl-CoA transferases/carnitine dehydratase n=1 Tax=Tropicibacter naphthalenivorans TaxID=441103 RepID=A0A0P1GYX1_9RHOB|nr:putative acyl-CoA transferases/carnitine dehydratase [Tropicibacter naphthalenivorans]SMC98276.1 CoA-transferase family III [Tropicibacter naphthalenivorans]
MVTGGAPRYQLYTTADGRTLAAAPLEQKFWDSFCEAIGLETALRDDTRDPAATQSAIAAKIKAKDAAHWSDVFEQADCCCTIVQTIQDALDDPHFAARGVFRRRVRNGQGDTMRALPTPVARTLAADPKATASAPALGADNDDFPSR